MTKAWRFEDTQFRRTRISVEGANKGIKSFKPMKYRREIITLSNWLAFWFVSAVFTLFFSFSFSLNYIKTPVYSILINIITLFLLWGIVPYFETSQNSHLCPFPPFLHWPGHHGKDGKSKHFQCESWIWLSAIPTYLSESLCGWEKISWFIC